MSEPRTSWDPDEGDVAEHVIEALPPEADATVPLWMRLRHSPTVKAVAAGLLLAGSLPPWGWWPLAFGGIALLDRLLAGTSVSSGCTADRWWAGRCSPPPSSG